MVTLTLSMLVAGRDLAAAAVSRLGTISGVEVAVDARPLASGTSSFAAQLVESILADGRAAHLVVLGGPAEFAADMKRAAVALGVADRISFREPALPA